MELRNEVTLPVGPDELFALLLDVERVAPCIPGATLEGADGDVYRASVKLKVGPVSAGYNGTVRFADVDHAARTAVLKASGKELRGQGQAEATINASVVGDASSSTLTMITELAIRGKLAQFGRGVINDVSENLMNQFAENLKAEMLGGPAEPAAEPAGPAANGAAAPAPPSATAPAASSAVGLGVVAGPVARRLGPALMLFVAGLLLGRITRR
jgi:carbon monoxide dehydrogenase subunit G